MSQLYQEGVVETYKDLFAGRPLKPTPDSEIIYDAVPAPSLIILDASFDQCHDMNAHLIPIFAVFLLPDNERHS